jgi:hypothetical protein
MGTLRSRELNQAVDFFIAEIEGLSGRGDNGWIESETMFREWLSGRGYSALN